MNMKKMCFLLVALCLVAALCIPLAAREETNTVMIFDGDTRFGSFTLDKNEKTQGSASLSTKLGGDSFVSGYTLKDTVDITDCDTVAFDLYISDTEQLIENVREMYFEISSAGVCDQEELQWSVISTLRDMNLEDGWNTVYMDIGTASKSGEIDVTDVDYLRFYTFHSGAASGLTLKLDNFRACYTGGEDFSDMELDAYQRDNSDVDIIIQGQSEPDLDKRDEGITKTAGFKK